MPRCCLRVNVRFGSRLSVRGYDVRECGRVGLALEMRRISSRWRLDRRMWWVVIIAVWEIICRIEI